MTPQAIASIKNKLAAAEERDVAAWRLAYADNPNHEPMEFWGPERLSVAERLGSHAMEQYWTSLNAIDYAHDNVEFVGGSALESLNPLQLRRLAIEWCKDCAFNFLLQYDGVEAIFAAAMPATVATYAAAFGEVPLRALEQKRRPAAE